MGTFTLQATATGLWNAERPTTPISSEASAQMPPPISLFFKFSAAPAAVLYKEILAVKASFWMRPGAGLSGSEGIYGVLRPVTAPWDPATLTYRNRPATAYVKWQTGATVATEGERVSGSISKTSAYAASPAAGTKNPLLDAILYGVQLEPKVISNRSGARIATHLDASEKPELEIEYGGDVVINPTALSPASGYIPKGTSCTFRWGTERSGLCLGDLTLTGVTFRWRVTGSETATEVDCGAATSYTLPGSSITADSIQWQVETTDSQGNVSTSGWRTLSTVEALSSAVAESPKNIMVDGSADTVFRWAHLIATGTAPSASELQISADGSTWTQLVTVAGSALETTIPAGTLPAGELQWRVRTSNTDEAPGAWSEPASILVVAAPPAPTVSVEQTPRPLISWQSQGQQGYQLRIPGAWESGSVYGTAMSRKLPVILPDGEYTVELRVVNEYGLWSDWGSAPLTVANIPGSAITLTAIADEAIRLSWKSAGAYGRYLVERDGAPLAVTQETNYTDLTAVGEHSYRVLGIETDSDNYGVSNTETVTLTVDCNTLTDLETGECLQMPYSTTQIQEERVSLERSVSMAHFTGADYPSAELTRYRDKSTSFEAAFRDLAQAARLEALLGRLVCLKSKNGESCTGIIPALQKVSSAFWVDYTATISKVDVSEEVEL